MTLQRVFVYGTLKKGEPNHNWFQPGNGFSKFIDNGITTLKYPLVIASKYNIPFLLDCPGNGYNVEGEVYEVDNKMLQNLDILEDHPCLYVRRKEDIKINESIEQCWTYFLQKYKPEMLTNEMFKSYSSTGSHNLSYCERYNRDPNYNLKSDILVNGT